MTLKFDFAFNLTGGSADSLDNKDGNDFDPDNIYFTIVIIDNEISFYYLDYDSGLTPDGITIIEPFTNPGNKRWLRLTNSEFLGSISTLGAIMNTAFDANTILAANVDNVPITVSIGENTIVGRIASGNIDDLTPTQVRTILNIENHADVTDADNVNAAGAVMESDFDANTILAAHVSGTPIAVNVATNTIVGRASTGNIDDLTPTQVRTMLNIEDGADATDTDNVNVAGAVMESDYNANTILIAISDDTPIPLTVAENTIIGRLTGESISDLTPVQVVGILTQRGSSTFAGAVGQTISITEMSDTTYHVSIMVNASSSTIGDIYITKTVDSFTIYNSGADTTTSFSWLII
jgi:hypothetical protein